MNKQSQKTEYKIKINNVMYSFDHSPINGAELLEISGNTPIECFELFQKMKDHDLIKINIEDSIDISTPGLEFFEVKETNIYKIIVDGEEPITTDKKTLTPNQILELADILPVSDYYIVQILSDGSQISYKDNPDDPITLKCPALKFVSIFRGATPVA